MPPRTVSCDICGQAFFQGSFPIHRKQCEKKYLARAANDDNYGGGRPDFAGDLRSQKNEFPPDKKNASYAQQGRGSGRSGAAAFGGGGEAPQVPMGLVPCRVCGRTFAADRGMVKGDVSIDWATFE